MFCKRPETFDTDYLTFRIGKPLSAANRMMLSKSGYSIEKIQPVDMFPHTYHIECVAKLVLK